MADKSKYQILNDLYNQIDNEFYTYQKNIAKLFEFFKEGLAKYLGCGVTEIGHADIKDIKENYDYSKIHKPVFNSLDYNQDTGFWTLIILIKLSTERPLILSFKLSIYHIGDIIKIFIEEINYKLESNKKQNIEGVFINIYEHVIDLYIKKEKEILFNNFIHYENKLRTIGF